MAARSPQVELIRALGLDPKLVDARAVESFIQGTDIVGAMTRYLRLVDEQDFIGRYKWYNLPEDIDQELLERMLYYRGQVAMFYAEEEDKFYILPYCLDGGLDVYGRYTGITPLPFNGSTETKEKKAWIPGLTKKPIYGFKKDGVTYEDFVDGCVLLDDHCKQNSQTILTRQQYQEDIIRREAECYPMARTALIANSGIKAWKVGSADEQSNVQAASNSILFNALTGNPFIAIEGSSIEFQDLTSQKSAMKSEEYLMYMQSLDNMRLAGLGLKNGGIFQKRERELVAENNMMSSNSGRIYADGLRTRQRFCMLANYIWDLGIWCEASETVTNIDKNGDGELTDSNVEQAPISNEQTTDVGGETNDAE